MPRRQTGGMAHPVQTRAGSRRCRPFSLLILVFLILPALVPAYRQALAMRAYRFVRDRYQAEGLAAPPVPSIRYVRLHRDRASGDIAVPAVYYTGRNAIDIDPAALRDFGTRTSCRNRLPGESLYVLFVHEITHAFNDFNNPDIPGYTDEVLACYMELAALNDSARSGMLDAHGSRSIHSTTDGFLWEYRIDPLRFRADSYIFVSERGGEITSLVRTSGRPFRFLSDRWRESS